MRNLAECRQKDCTFYKRKRHSLNEVDHPRLRVGHLPTLGQWLLALITWQAVPGAKVHTAAGLCVAGHSPPPLGSLLVFCEWKENKPVSGTE